MMIAGYHVALRETWAISPNPLQALIFTTNLTTMGHQFVRQVSAFSRVSGASWQDTTEHYHHVNKTSSLKPSH
jgi:hypothetical protein